MSLTIGSGGLPFGKLLDGLFDRVDDAIQQAVQEAKIAGIELEINAGAEIALAIENAKNAYKESLDYTIDRVSKEAQAVFNNLSSMAEKLTVATKDELQQLQIQAQQLVNSLPFSSKQPQLSSIKPRYIIPTETQSSMVTFKGNFPYSAKPGFKPTLNFGGVDCYLVDVTAQSLVFQVPQKIFTDHSLERYTFTTGKLQVPFDDGIIFSHKTQFEYQVGLGSLPQLAGKGSVEYVNKVQERQTSRVASPTYNFNGNDWYPEHWHEKLQEIYPPAGWKIDVTKKPDLVVAHRHGDHKQEIIAITPDKIVVKVGLYCKSGEDIGIVDIRVDFDTYRDMTIEKKRKEDFVMNWKDSKLLEPQGSEIISKVVFDDYKGTHDEFAGPDLQRSILKLEAEANGKWKIWAEAPKDLRVALNDISPELREKMKEAHRLQKLLHFANLPKEVTPPALKHYTKAMAAH